MAAKTINYRLGAAYAVAAAALLSAQEPFSYLAARRLDAQAFVLVTQVSLLLSIPLLNFKPQSRRDFLAILGDPAMYGKLGVIFLIGMSGLILYKLGLTGAHPIIIAAIFNLSPFWAAAVARAISGVPIPVAPATFFACLVAAFLGAMAVAWSQLATGSGDLWESFLRGSWVFASPIPLFSALNGTLIGKWFSKYEESASIAVNFLVPSAVLIPLTLYQIETHGGFPFQEWPAILLMMFGTVVAASIGRVISQIALSVTGNDNGYVTMFFLLVPALTGLISLPLSLAIPDLKFHVNAIYLVGLALIGAALGGLSLMAWRMERAAARR